jgi:Putative auto-transporter adhesin, head GIN domain
MKMKKIFLITLIIFSTTISAQITKLLGDFTKVTAFDKISVQLIAANENKIEISGSLASDVEVFTKNDDLKIRMKIGNFLNGENIVAKVYFKNLIAIEANEGSYISCETQIEESEIDLISKEGAEIKLDLQVQKLTIKTSQGGKIKLKGYAEIIDIVTNSGGIVDAQECQSKEATVSVNAGGSVDIYAKDLVNAKTRAGGTITIYGNPKQINEKKVLGGSIVISNR